MPFKPHAPKPYPFRIPSLPKLRSEKARKLDRHDVLRFFQIEALLRSEVVWALYRQAILRTRLRRTTPMVTDIELWVSLFGKNKLKLRGEAHAPIRRLLWDESLRNQFGIADGWAVLIGSHHRYLRPRKPSFRIGTGIVDLSILHRRPPLEFRLEYLEKKQTRNLYLMIDSAEVTSSDLAVLKEVLLRRQQEARRSAGVQKAPIIVDPYAWLRYLRSYDLHIKEGLSLDEIGRRVWEAPARRTAPAAKERASARRAITRAVKNVKALIDSAQRGPWVFPRL
jgi:hypothetical protein